MESLLKLAPSNSKPLVIGIVRLFWTAAAAYFSLLIMLFKQTVQLK